MEHWARLKLNRRRAADVVLADHLLDVYTAVSEVSGAEVVVDTSKFPVVPLVLAGRCDLRVVHLVRDPRAVALSWRTEKSDPSDGGSPMNRLGTMASSLKWVEWNLAIDHVVSRVVPTLRLRYEDWMRQPAATLRSIFGFLDMPDRGSPHPTAPASYRLPVGHTISGNPGRFRPPTEETHLVLDRRWEQDLPLLHRFAVDAVAGPLMWHYGYDVVHGSANQRVPARQVG